MNQYFITYCIYVSLIFALLIGFGFLFHLLVSVSWKNFGYKFGMIACFPRLIGTPIHELGHLIFALLTGARIKKIKLFPKINMKERTCGGAYVQFVPKRGIVGSLSLFLAGIGPMIFCPLVILTLMYFLMPELFPSVIDVFQHVNITDVDEIFPAIGEALLGFVSGFQIDMLRKWEFWVFLLVSIPIANECILSGADMKNAWKGFLVLFIVLIAIGGGLSFFPSACLKVVSWIVKGVSLLCCVLCFGLVFNLLYWVAGWIVIH